MNKGGEKRQQQSYNDRFKPLPQPHWLPQRSSRKNVLVYLLDSNCHVKSHKHTSLCSRSGKLNLELNLIWVYVPLNMNINISKQFSWFLERSAVYLDGVFDDVRCFYNCLCRPLHSWVDDWYSHSVEGKIQRNEFPAIRNELIRGEKTHFHTIIICFNIKTIQACIVAYISCIKHWSLRTVLQ